MKNYKIFCEEMQENMMLSLSVKRRENERYKIPTFTDTTFCRGILKQR